MSVKLIRFLYAVSIFILLALGFIVSDSLDRTVCFILAVLAALLAWPYFV